MSLRRRHDPAPSLLRYRLGRLWLTPGFWRFLRVGPPVLLVLGATIFVATDATTRARIAHAFDTARATIVNRDEFRVATLDVHGAGQALVSDIGKLALAELPASSLDLDISDLRDRIAALPAVAQASVRIDPGGILRIDVTERMPVLLWRNDGALSLLDPDGIVLGRAGHRADHPDLPLILGPGAETRVGEALDLLVAAGPVSDRIRGLQRIADRRWNLVLDRDLTIMLPENRPRAALRRVMGLHAAEDLLNRDITTVDLRNGDRPILRLGAFAHSELKRLRAYGAAN